MNDLISIISVEGVTASGILTLALIMMFREMRRREDSEKKETNAKEKQLQEKIDEKDAMIHKLLDRSEQILIEIERLKNGKT